MNREDWTTLDELLGKEGFGGYYDLKECLEIVILDYGQLKGMRIEEIQKYINKNTTVEGAVSLLLTIQRMRR